MWVFLPRQGSVFAKSETLSCQSSTYLLAHATKNTGSCRYYSSTGFQIAGLVLLALQERGGENGATHSNNITWAQLDIAGPLFRNSSRGRFDKLRFYSDEPHLSQRMTVPATEYMKGWGPHNSMLKVPVWGQSSTSLGAKNAHLLRHFMPNMIILPSQARDKHRESTQKREREAISAGWTCGNLVGPPLQVARFFFDLLGPSADRTNGTGRIVSRATSARMSSPMHPPDAVRVRGNGFFGSIFVPTCLSRACLGKFIVFVDGAQ